MINNENHLIEYLKKFISIQRVNLFNNKIEQRTKHVTVVLEDIYQSRNISASLRSADCFGIQDVHIIENNHAFDNDPEVSMGAEKWISVVRHNKNKNNTIDVVKKLKKRGYEIIVTSPHNTDYNLFDIDVNSDKKAVCFGSEINGCSKTLLGLADKKISIPMYGFTESFNVSVSVSLCLQHITYMLRKNNINWKLDDFSRKQVLLQWLRNSIKYSDKIEKKYLEF